VARLRLSIDAFLAGQWHLGALAGTTPEEAFYVKCDRATMSQADLDAGDAIVVLGFAPLRPVEFVVLRIRLRTASSTMGS